jgi:hypothetical protein
LGDFLRRGLPAFHDEIRQLMADHFRVNVAIFQRDDRSIVEPNFHGPAAARSGNRDPINATGQHVAEFQRGRFEKPRKFSQGIANGNRPLAPFAGSILTAFEFLLPLP